MKWLFAHLLILLTFSLSVLAKDSVAEENYLKAVELFNSYISAEQLSQSKAIPFIRVDGSLKPHSNTFLPTKDLKGFRQFSAVYGDKSGISFYGYDTDCELTNSETLTESYAFINSVKVSTLALCFLRNGKNAYGIHLKTAAASEYVITQFKSYELVVVETHHYVVSFRTTGFDKMLEKYSVPAL